MTENEKARELIATSETTVKVDPQNGWYLKRFAALQFEGSVDNFGTNMPIHVLEQQLPKEDTMKLDDAVIEGQEIDYSRFYDEKGNESTTVCIDAENPDDAIEKVSQALNSGDANMSADVASSIGYSMRNDHYKVTDAIPMDE